MRTFYDSNKCCIVYTCPHCNYSYHQYSDYDKQYVNNEEPFIKMCEVLLTETPNRGLTRLPQYACPSCGILQIDVSDI